MSRRTTSRTSLLIAPAVLVAAACADQTPLAPRATPGEAARVITRLAPRATRYLVGLSAGTRELPPAVLTASGGRVVERIRKLGIVVVDGVTSPSALTGTGVRYAEPEGWFASPAAPAERPPVGIDRVTARATATAEGASWYASGVQWNMRSIGASGGWDASAGAGARVCIIDTGIDEAHQELAGRVVARTSFVPNDTLDASAGFSPAPLDSNGHGSHVAGIVGARGVVTAGVAPEASLMAAKVFAATGGTPTGRVVRALVWCTDYGAHVVNVSLGGISYLPGGAPASSHPTYQAYAAGINYATDRGVVVVTAAGNENLQLPNPQQFSRPAQVAGTIAVGATGPVSKTFAVDGNPDPAVVTPVRVPAVTVPTWDATNPAHVWQGPDGKAFYSNFGTAVTVFAPGGSGALPLSYVHRIALVPGGLPGVRTVQGGPYDNIYSVCSSVTDQFGPVDVGGAPRASESCRNAPNRYVSYYGTSMAAPHVAGMAAVLYSELGGTRSAANRARVMNCIQTTADDIGPASTFGGGRVNVTRAVAALRAGTC